MRWLFVGETQIDTILKRQTLKILASVAGLLALTAWAHEFVWTGIKSNIYLNGGIIGLFAFGVIMVLAGMRGLRNEGVAFAALQEAYDDIRQEKVQSQRDPFWRHYRALQPGRVFTRPTVLGHMFELTYDELLRSKDIRISVGTMQNLVQGIEAKLADDRSLSVYITGLLVFLGLIGTFIGLMEMVGSVGGIIGSLQGMQTASGSAIQQLLKNLEEPLRGMATGFSSSLFGLFGSLTLGIIGRMGATASNAMKHEFEDWLAGVAQLENRKSGEVGDLARMISNNLMGVPQPVAGAGAGAGQGGAAQQAAQPAIGVTYGGHSPLSDVGVVATLSQGFGRSNDSLSNLNNNMGKLVEAQLGAAEMIRQMAANIDRMAGDAAQTREHLMTVASQQNTHAEYLQELVNLNRTLESRLTSGFNGMAHVMEVTGQAYLDGLRRLTAENYETNARLAKLLDVKAASDRITEIATGIESKVKGSFGTMTTMLERTAIALESSVQKVAEGQKEIKEALQTGVGGTVGMSSEFEQKLASSFSEMSRSFETVFAAYSTIVSKAMVNQPAHNGPQVDGPAMARDRALQSAWAPAEHASDTQEQTAAAEDESRRQFYEMAARQLRSGQAG